MNSSKSLRFWLQPLLIFIGICALLYKISTYFPSATISITSTLESFMQQQPWSPITCTTIGEDSPREVLLAAASCLDECRKSHLERDTYQPTQEYDACKHECAAAYQYVCVDTQEETSESSNNPSKKTQNFRITGRRLQQTA